MKNFIQKYKIIIILALTAMVIVVSSYFLSNKQTNEAAPSPTPKQNSAQYPPPSPANVFVPPSYSQPELNSQGQVDKNSIKVQEASSNKQKLVGKLPIYIQNFKTTSGLLTTLNVYTIPEDPEYLIRIDIYGLNYEEMTTDKTQNPNVIPFIDSFNEIKRQLIKNGVDIKNIYFIFGGRNYIQETAQLWIETYKLL